PHASHVLVSASRRNKLPESSRSRDERAPQNSGAPRELCFISVHLWLLLAHDLHFSFQFDSALLSCGLLDSIDQLKDIARPCSALVDDEITVHFGNACFSDRRIFQSEFVD